MHRTLTTIWLLMLAWIMLSGCSTNQSAIQPATEQEGSIGNSQPAVIRQAASNPNNGKPIVIPAATPLLGGIPLSVHFWDNGSYDPDGDQLVSWEWNFADEEEGQGGWHDYTATQGDAWHTYSSAGTYTAHLRITDSTGRKGVDHIQITLDDGFNANPIAIAGANPLSGDAPLEVSFSAPGSYDPDGNIVKYEWDFGTGIFLDYTPSQGGVSTTYGSGGLYTAILRLTDDDGAIATDSVIVEVNSPPTAVASADPTSGTAPLTVYLSAQGSYDPDGFIVSYEWDFGEGGGFQDFTLTQGETDHIYTQVDTYTVTLRVTDDSGKAITASVEIEVLEPNAQGDWWMFGHDPQHTRRSPFTGPMTNTLKWVYTTGSVVSVSSPTIGADGTVYIGGYNPNKLFAVNSNGTLKWAYSTGGAIVSSPAISTDGTVYIGSSHDSTLRAINPDGSLKWAYTAGGAIAETSPVIGADGTVYVENNDGKLYAINPDGTLKWTYTTGGGLARSSPAIGADGTLYAGGCDNKLHAVNPDGSLKWTYPMGGEVRSSPAIDMDGIIYVGNNDGKLYAINPDGTLKWSYATGGPVYSSPAIGTDGIVYVGSWDYKLYAINPDGTLKWTYTTGYYVESSPAIGADGTVYVGSYDYKLYAVNPDGSLKWAYTTGNYVRSSPAIGADGTVYVGSHDSKLYAIGPGEGF